MNEIDRPPPPPFNVEDFQEKTENCEPDDMCPYNNLEWGLRKSFRVLDFTGLDQYAEFYRYEGDINGDGFADLYQGQLTRRHHWGPGLFRYGNEEGELKLETPDSFKNAHGDVIKTKQLVQISADDGSDEVYKVKRFEVWPRINPFIDPDDPIPPDFPSVDYAPDVILISLQVLVTGQDGGIRWFALDDVQPIPNFRGS